MTPQRLLIWIMLFSVPLFVLVGYLLLRPTPTIVYASEWIAPDSALKVDIPATASGRLYRFSADPNHQTQLKLDTDNPDFAFAAEVRDADGNAVAILNGSRLQNASLTIQPGSTVYQLALSSAVARVPGTVSLTLGEPPSRQAAPPTPVPPPCGIISAMDTGIDVRSGPRMDYATIGTLDTADMLVAHGKIRGGWYLTDVLGHPGWVPGNLVRVYGACDHLPMVLDPSIPVAPHDREPYVLTVDRDGDGQVSEVISYPNDDPTDFVWINVVNLYDRPPANYREFTVFLTCTGIGMENVRWGAPSNPTHRCGESRVLPFMADLSQQPIAITLPSGSEQSYITYTLTAVSNHRSM
jgi:hypothetical protein